MLHHQSSRKQTEYWNCVIYTCIIWVLEWDVWESNMEVILCPYISGHAEGDKYKLLLWTSNIESTISLSFWIAD